MANAVRGRSDTRDAGANDGDLGPVKLTIGAGRVGRDGFGDDPLQELVDEEERVEERVCDLSFGGHCCVGWLVL